MPEPATIVDRYLEAYGEPDSSRRLALIAAAWTDDGELIDPPLDGAGHSAISTVADAVQAQFPAHTFRRTSDVDFHHRFVRFTWELVGPDGHVGVHGTDFGELSDDGRLRRIVGFLGDQTTRDAA